MAELQSTLAQVCHLPDRVQFCLFHPSSVKMACSMIPFGPVLVSCRLVATTARLAMQIILCVCICGGGQCPAESRQRREGRAVGEADASTD